uniref:Phospholipase A2 n=1 Tax=Pyricularia oryzae (strain P131) TaxID=1143193 RepID=L7IXU4_PYRO1
MQLSILVSLVALSTSIAAQDAAPKPCAQQLGRYTACVATAGGTGGCHAARLSREQTKSCIKNCDDNSGYTLCLKETPCHAKYDSCVSQCTSHQDQCLATVHAKFGPAEQSFYSVSSAPKGITSRLHLLGCTFVTGHRGPSKDSQVHQQWVEHKLINFSYQLIGPDRIRSNTASEEINNVR